jgi:2-aminoethylphosphonate dioxygenase
MITNTFSDKVAATIEQAVVKFSDAGVAVIRELLTPAEVRTLLEECARLWELKEIWDTANLRCGIRKGLNGERLFERLDPVADISQKFADLNRDRRLVVAAEMSLGAPVIVLKEKLIYKWPGTSGYGAHRDEPYFGVANGVPGAEMVTICVALDRMYGDNGAIKFYPGLRRQTLPAPPDEPRDVTEQALEGCGYVMPELEPGDVVLFDGLVPHSSDFNRSSIGRRTYMVTYASDRYPDCRKQYYANRLTEQERERSAGQPGVLYHK